MKSDLQTVVTLPSHPCYVGGGEYDHDWELQDDSFDHEFGCEQIQYYRCEICDAEKDLEAADYDPFWELYLAT